MSKDTPKLAIYDFTNSGLETVKLNQGAATARAINNTPTQNTFKVLFPLSKGLFSVSINILKCCLLRVHSEFIVSKYYTRKTNDSNQFALINDWTT